MSNHNTLNDLSNNVCIPNKTLTKHLSCGYKGRFHGKKCNSNYWWNNNKCRCDCKKVHVCEKDIWNPATWNCENGKYLASIMDKTVCDEIIDVKETNFNEKHNF